MVSGYSRITKQVYLGGEDGLERVLQEVDLWIDFRNLTSWNKQVIIPDSVSHYPLPFLDGDWEAAVEVYPRAMSILLPELRRGKRALISCHKGVFRSALFVVMLLAEHVGSYDRAYTYVRSKRAIDFDPGFIDLVNALRARYHELS